MATKYYAFLLTSEEAQDSRKKGMAYALLNKDKWIDLSEVFAECNTYDKGTTVFYKDGKEYQIFKDFINIDENYRVYIAVDYNLIYNDSEKIQELIDSGEITMPKD